MKLIIDIPENEYQQIKEYYEKNDIVESIYSYIYHGTLLEKEPCDCISRVETLEKFKPKGITDEVWMECNEYKVISSMPSVQPKAEIEINRREDALVTTTGGSEIPIVYYPQVEGITPTVVIPDSTPDKMTTQQVIDQLNDIIDIAGNRECNDVEIDAFKEEAIKRAIQALQEQKIGHWIEHPHEAGENWEYSRYECSECHIREDYDSDYCPNCGIKMEE